MSKQIEEVMALVEEYGSSRETHYKGAEDELSAIEAKLRELLPGWLPIESAPKDGHVLAWCENAPPQSYRVQAVRIRNGEFLTSWNPTHWRTLPSAPSQEVAGS